MPTSSLTAMRALAAALSIAAAIVLAPLWASLVLAAWFADLLRPAVRRFERLLGRRRAAAAVVVLVVVGVLLPLSGIIAAIVAGAEDLLAQARAALEGHGSLGAVLLGSGGAAQGWEPRDWADLVTKYGTNAWRAMSTIARASASAVIAILVFVAALYTFVVDGENAYEWMRTNTPIPHDAFDRLARAFRETGRGLIVAGGGTALLQGTIATAAYVALGIPRALLLGPLTAVCAIVPFVGTGIVWVPLAIELAATGEVGNAVVVTAVGLVNSVVDNLVRPFLARFGRLELPAFVVLVAMVGGIAVFGAAGALLGPLLVRLCVEALAILSDARRALLADPEPTAHDGDPDREAQSLHDSGAAPTARDVRPCA